MPAADYGFKVGDRTTVLLADGTQPEVEVVGIFTFGEANNLLGARLTAFDVDIAPEVFGTGDQVDSIDVAVECPTCGRTRLGSDIAAEYYAKDVREAD